MKKLISFLTIMLAFTFVVPITSEAQYVYRKAKDSLTAAGTKYITYTASDDGIVSFNLTGIKVSGTVSAYAILQTRVDTLDALNWEDYLRDGTIRDTLFFTDVSTYRSKIFATNNLYGNGYRMKIVATGTQKIYFWSSYLRRNRRS